MTLKVPDGSFASGGWLCTVCCRGACVDRERWSWLACEYCKKVDRRAAGLFGGARILPLGRHSIMNGAGVSLSLGDSPERTAAIEQLVSMGGEWSVLQEWKSTRVADMAARLGWVPMGSTGEVDFDDWQREFPNTPQASAEAFLAYLREHQAYLLEMEPRLREVDWLADIEIPEWQLDEEFDDYVTDGELREGLDSGGGG